MLRVHCVQLFYNLRDPGMEDLLYEAESVRRFVGLRLSEALPDESTILHFRHILEKHELGEGLFEEIKGLSGVPGTAAEGRDHSGRHHHRSAVAPPRTGLGCARPGEPPDQEGEPISLWDESAYRGGCGYGCGAQLSDDPANVHDVTEAHRLLHGESRRYGGMLGYVGVEKRWENRELALDWQVAMKPGRRRQLDPGSNAALTEKRKASIRAKVEHPFLKVKQLFGYAKVRYRGLAKNTQRLALLLGLGNLLTAESRLAA